MSAAHRPPPGAGGVSHPVVAPNPVQEVGRLYALAVAQQQAGRVEAAIETYARCLTLDARYPEIHNNLGTALDTAGRLQEAVECFERALTLDPVYVRPLVNLGRVLRLQRKPSQALARLEQALALSPDNAAALTNLGFALADLGRSREALAALRRAIVLAPTLAEAHHGLGRVLGDRGDVAAALDSLQRALQIKPALADACLPLANTLVALQRLPEALAVTERLLEVRPEDVDALAVRLNCAVKMCEWEKVERTLARIRRLPRGTADFRPFLLMGISDQPAEHLAAACTQAAAFIQERVALPSPSVRQHDRIRVAYVSRDFYTHATAFLTAELFELHDRSVFEIYGVSLGPDDDSPLGRRVRAAFDVWLDGPDESDFEIATWMREHEIDIAVDLKGYTAYSRPGIFAYRPAPVQVSYLGYPGTMAAPFMDYIIADRWVIPEAEQEFYTEKIAYLPDSYQANDRQRHISAHTLTREEAGLPGEGFVFCCFNNNWKITREVFDIWTRLLARVPGSVLWLLEDNPWAAENLRTEASRRDIEPKRLIFAPRTDAENHLARHRVADLFLDTLPYNAHTTASDALWSGLPVVTCAGRSFASRVAASLLSAAGLSELVTSSLEEYEALALELAHNGTLLAAFRARLTRDREALPLFDTPGFCRHLEAAYRRMWLMQREARAPQTFAVERLRLV